ncbi:MAG: 50S ribosomal protein L6 [uncultured bacterium]|uniref:Large ribosomal subunit protein uL6 n=1 Tax=Candidatus Uhrbacteria bacterium GW2011_GWC1_41_20 TaxID=1618983 RepID=A0A0G0VIA4_9BACT|nr:MAG: 50S ribosomal protein L6 [uncultured bacterium]KKR22734.1 MAG: 50S ribosomal protein L6 [Candidatus Uhrbacteria bacterium GW2011_GWE1_39_46]KKR64087.1 MAG: 50S ribosomal protein L6 [Candidatus Uhrbacteria bacterium GW2011_GWC2_40_450]KKR90012.1 MAG: 50S ribosomal protein L6 [Candidatus Uhrbacteria bacterium GW2011_GWD2_41_121]KKR90645.1 MAG: 50S ribosomal protein L6 [Candidatus Uhrbacteria bacterium GW2011_GWE2_41_1153]KKR95922.1 MAG: 50S ribosomal protein L6 [Candidatus Uhrbacteria ba
MLRLESADWVENSFAKFTNMSRIGKKFIDLPSGVEISTQGNAVVAKGPKGELRLEVFDVIHVNVDQETKKVQVTVDDIENNSAIWGTTRANIANMIIGVSEGWSKSLELQGVGFRMEVRGRKLVMRLGFSHEVEYNLPDGIEATVENAILTIKGTDRQTVGQVTAEIRSIKEPEPYKGKGFRYTDEIVRRKAGKAAKSE